MHDLLICNCQLVDLYLTIQTKPMPEPSNNPSNFWHELKRRKVIRVIIAYVVVGFAIIEFVDIVTEPLGLPEWALTLVIVLVAVGFPIAIIFAWIFDITTKGIKKTEPVTAHIIQEEAFSGSEKSIIVLPLEDISPGKDNEYFADGLTEEITADLSQINDLLVISRSSAMTFKRTQKKVTEIANEVNVRYVLEGSVRKAEDKLRITAQLIDANTDTHLWAKKYDGCLDDVFSMQENVSKDIVESLKLKLTTDEKNRIESKPIDNFEAYDFYLKAYQGFWEFSEEASDRGLKYLQDAASIIGDNDLLYSAMALIYYQYVSNGIKQEEFIAKAKEYAQKALALNPNSSKAHHVMGLIALHINGNPKDAVNHLKHAVLVEPSLLPALYSLIAAYCYCGKISIAIQLVERLKNINPISFQTYFFEGFIQFHGGEYHRAIDPFRRMIEIDPNNPINYYYAWVLINCNRTKEASTYLNKYVSSEDTFEQSFGQILRFALLKNKEKVLYLLNSDFLKTSARSGAASYQITSIFAFIGEKEKAMFWLENAVDRGFLNYPLLAEKDPFLESIRGEELFKELMKKVKHLWENFEG
jgi:non-specific serine/threonine protein kinase